MSFNGWTSIKLGELIESISIKHDFEKDELIFLNTSDVLEGKVLHHNYSEVAKMPGQAKKSIQKGDILFSEIRPKNKRFAYIDFDAKDFVVSTKLMVLRRKSSLIDNKFLYKLLTSDRMLNYLQHIAEGRSGTFPQITFSELKNIDVLLPSIQEQIAIAKTLDDLDEKIETNNKINKKLEEMAQAIFKQWFVDFEFPNEDGKPYKSSDGEMVESELGIIPKGWEVKKVAEMIETILGGTPSRKNESYWENGSIAWINSGKINEFRITEPSEYITEEAVKKSSTKLLPKRTTVIAITGATLGQVSLLEIDSCTNQSVVGLKENEILKAEYIYCWMKEEIKLLANLQTGGAQQHINKDNVNMRNIIIPKKDILNKYYNIMESIFDKISNSVFEVRELTILRNTLLPKLMSGEIRVPID